MHPNTTAFGLLHPRLQEHLYRMKWTRLRQIQVDAIQAILGGDNNIIISAGTAGGKTEAAFLPILSSIADNHLDGVRALYVGPLRALINDQFRRLEELCELAAIPVHRWHGEVGQSARQALLTNPGGVLLITPESIESLMVNHSPKLRLLFGRLQYAVIDELHCFIGSERGAQLRSLLHRLEQIPPNPFRILALSATLGEPERAAAWLSTRSTRGFTIINGSASKSLRYRVKGYYGLAAEQDEACDTGGSPPALDSDVVRAFSGQTALVFVNSRSRLEMHADRASRLAIGRGQRHRFRAHHGSLSKAEREDTEAALRSELPTVTFCSSTLELGIDVGSISAIGQIGAPWSVNSLAQRLGRSGRQEGEPAVLWMFIEEGRATPADFILDRLYPEMLQGLAMSELLLSHWHEPPDLASLHLSTLVQQIMSVIGERGGASAPAVAGTLLDTGAFPNVETQMLLDVLRGMAAHDLIEQTPESDLILGLRGEKIIRSLDFYAVFTAEREYQVVHGSQKIGSVTMVGTEQYLILAGRRWRIEHIDEERRVIAVVPAAGGKAPHFAGHGRWDVHPVVHARMRQLLTETAVPVYADDTAREMLNDAREAAKQMDLAHQNVVQSNGHTVLLTWAGTRVTRTIWAMIANILGIEARDYGFAVAVEGPAAGTVARDLAKLDVGAMDVSELSEQIPLHMKLQEKYDWVLPQHLLDIAYARSSLDLPGAAEFVASLKSGFHPPA